MIRLRPATEADAAAWDALLAAAATGDFLHDRAWAAVAAFDGQPQRRFVLEDDDAVVALVAAQVRPLVGGSTFWYVPARTRTCRRRSAGGRPDARDRHRIAGDRALGRGGGREARAAPGGR